jgi:hypothetical protein
MRPKTLLSAFHLWLFLTIVFTFSASAQEEARLSIAHGVSGEFVIAVQPQLHSHWGILYPLTIELSIPAASSDLKVEKKSSTEDTWDSLPEKGPTDHFDGIEAVRFDYALSLAYVSASFSPTSDSLFLRVSDKTDNVVASEYRGIAKYYDNRRAAVTVTADDWSDWTAGWFPALLSIFRSYGLFVTAGVISGSQNTAPSTWTQIQQQLDSGFVEIAAHSRTHPEIPYNDPYGEVVGCFDDIVNNLILPLGFRTNDREYVYVWLAPYGHTDATVDSLLALRTYLVSRLYPDNGDFTFSEWDEKRSHFVPFYPTKEIGAPSWGGGTTDLSYLNATFDTVANHGGLYHFMWHPQTVYDDRNKAYFIGHLEYISRRTDIWYANLGQIYLYHLIQEANSAPTAVVSTQQWQFNGFRLEQNYPNPFNPITSIRYELAVSNTAKLVVYDVLGREISILVDGREQAGVHEVRFNATGLSSGVYYYRLSAGPVSITKKMLVVR